MRVANPPLRVMVQMIYGSNKMGMMKFRRTFFIGILALIACGNFLNPIPAHAGDSKSSTTESKNPQISDVDMELLKKRAIEIMRESMERDDRDKKPIAIRLNSGIDYEFLFRIVVGLSVLIVVISNGNAVRKANSMKEMEDQEDKDENNNV